MLADANRFISDAICCAVRYKYCPKCKKAYVRSRLEGDGCYCGADCETIDVKRNSLYYFGYGIMILGAASAFVPRFMVVADSSPFIYFGIALVIVGSIFVVVGSTKMAKTAVEMALQKDEKSE
jgi:hypothetical protein